MYPMTEEKIEQIMAIATEFVNRTDTRDPENAKRFTSKATNVYDRPHNPKVWTVMFGVFDHNGVPIDSDFFIYVDKKTMQVVGPFIQGL
jgi:hypothetical protein